MKQYCKQLQKINLNYFHFTGDNIEDLRTLIKLMNHENYKKFHEEGLYLNLKNENTLYSFDKNNNQIYYHIVPDDYIAFYYKDNSHKINRIRILSSNEFHKEYIDIDEVSDGYHTFNELYRYRLLYNAAFFNQLAKIKGNPFKVIKSKFHSDGQKPFGGGWFIVQCMLPTGQISNHYELKDWDLFKIPEMEKAYKWDGHSPEEAANRLEDFLKQF